MITLSFLTCSVFVLSLCQCWPLTLSLLGWSKLNTKVTVAGMGSLLLSLYLLFPLSSLPIHALLILVPSATVPGLLSHTQPFLCPSHCPPVFHPWHIVSYSTWCSCPAANIVQDSNLLAASCDQTFIPGSRDWCVGQHVPYSCLSPVLAHS